MSIDPVEFGELKGMVNTTLANTNQILEKFDTKLDDHDDRIVDLEVHKSTMKRACKWIGSGITAVFAFIMWVME